MGGDTFVVVGGDAAGMSAAGKAARDAPDLDVVVLERGEWVAYGACGLPYYVKGEVPAVEDLLARRPERFVEEYGIDLRRGHEAVGVDPDAVTVEDGDGRYEQPYDDLLVATGGRATVPDVPGTDLDGVFTLRSIEAGQALRAYLVREGGDAGDPTAGGGRPAAGTTPGTGAPSRTGTPSDAPRGDPTAPADRLPAPETAVGADGGAAALRRYLRDGDPEAVAVVGANKIGLELVEAFDALGLTVHLVAAGDRPFEHGPRTLPPFGAVAAAMTAEHLRERGVTLHFGAELTGFAGEDGRVTAVETAAGRVPADAVLLDLGVEPNVELAADAGADVGPTGAVATDAYGRTGVPGVYAAGDCAEKEHAVTGEAVALPLALPATRAGRAVGRTVAGTPTPVGRVLGTTVSKVFDLELARTGLLDPDDARAAGFDPVAETATTITRAHYYPGWSRIAVEMTADAGTGRLLGAGLAGREGAAHRVNAAATAVHAGMSAAEVGALDYGYSPPFGPVWDPVLLGAKVLAGEVD